MFADEALDSVSVRSLWRNSHQSEQESRGCQTRAVLSAEAEIQTTSTAVSCTQTEPQDQVTEQLFQQNHDEPEPPGLKDFLQRVEDTVIRELVKNARSHAFDGFQANWVDHSQLVSCLHCLQHPIAQERGLHVTSVSWNCTGSVIACAYGRIDDGCWSTERSYVCTWNLDRRALSPKQADLVIDVPTAVTALCCHPNQPALIAGGLYSGEVVVWDTSQTQDPVLALTGMSADSHREPVYQVAWVPLQKKGEFGVLSASSGGRVLLWMVDSDQGGFVLNAAYALVRQQVPHSSSDTFKARGSSTVGVTSLALSPWDPDTFLVGSEGGLLLRCSLSSKTLAATASEGQSVTLRAPAVFSFRPRSGPIHSIHCSPFHRNLFVSAGTDGLAHVHSMLQADPLLSLRVSESYVFQVQWSPTRPLVFAAATGQGEVQIFDLGRRSLRPAATIQQGAAGQAATCLSFNRQNPHLLAVGSADGKIGVWQLSTDLTEQRPRESSQLEQIANQMAE
ncbi:WD repeat-containing protein 34 [Toxotes jaculatrix]|uniref:WD repeat-containing protein 34 n=1 Tax=Toxotes jaculatrix TaxID=941984 RepID=UPI001B3A8653|nr:WD repeat-containing protein 34 [Toxotes jaculatrix]XP_040915696.1 WD repeat-containing protein 34 [Toxotes jaculatrix]